MGLRVAQCSQKPCEDSCRSVSGARRRGLMWEPLWLESRGRGRQKGALVMPGSKSSKGTQERGR